MMGALINQSQRSIVYTERAKEGDRELVWKVCSPAINSIAELTNEFDITAGLNIIGIRKPVQKGVFQNKDAFAYVCFPGGSLKSYLLNNSFSITGFLSFSIRLVNILSELHGAGIFHLRINSNNILYDPSTDEIQLIDFSLSSRETHVKTIDFQSWGSELAYIAPEQTGRLNQFVDTRTDLYSLGIVLYEMLTGQLPYAASDSAEIVLNHLIQIPASPITISKQIPEVVSKIIDKLLAKKPDERYQSAVGLLQDLLLCQQNLNNKQNLQSIQIGLQDQSYQLKLSEKIFGRETEFAELIESVNKASRGGNELIFLSGETGIGKTVLVEALKKSIQEKEGIMISEKYDASMQNLPYHGIITALKDIAAIILSEPDAKLAEWKAVVSRAAEENSKQLIELIPEFEWIIGESVSLNSHGGKDQPAHVNLSDIYHKILQGITTQRRFVVLYMEDLQWADLSSWRSIQSLVANTGIHHLFIICSYRSAHISGSIHHNNEVNQLITLRPGAHHISPGNLSELDVTNFINDSLNAEDSAGLGKLVYAKTLGHPFFLHQFLKSVYRENILRFSPQKMIWVWDRERMADVELTDNVVDFISNKIEQLPEESRQVLMIASCIGNRFHPLLLQSLMKKEEDIIANILKSLVDEKILDLKQGGNYAFSHERVREATYAAMPPQERSLTHYTIATKLSGIDLPEDEELRVFNVANHYNLAQEHIIPEEHFKVAMLNYHAGMQAKKSAAFEVAYRYFVSGISFLNESDWDKHYAEVLSLYNEATELGMLTGAQDEAKRWLDKSVRKAKTINDSIKAHEIQLNHFSENHNFPEAVAYLLQVLRQLGYPISRNPGKVEILKEYAQVRWLLRNKKIEDIPNLPLIENEGAKAFVKLTVNSLASIFGNAPDILPIVIFRQVRLSLLYGNSVYSPIAYCSYGFAITVFIGDLEKGYRFGKMALELADKLDAEIVKAKVLVQFYAFLSYWKDPLRQSVAPLREAYFIGKKNGDFLYASFGLSFHSAIRLHAGDHLQELMEVMSADCESIRNMNQELVYIISESQRQLVVQLTHVTPEPWILKNQAFDEIGMLKQLEELGDTASKFDIYYYKLVLACIFNEYRLGIEYSESAAIYEDETTSRQITYPSFLMFSTMAILKQSVKDKSGFTRTRLMRKVASRIRLVHKMTKHAPQNFSNKHSFLQALFFEEKGDHAKALQYYHDSIAEAQNSNFIHEEAIAREHLAYYYMSKTSDEYGELMLQKSYDCYERWGASAKCAQLRRLYPNIIGKVENRNREGIAGFQNIYDLNMIINANQALSSENSLEGLLRRFMEIVIQNASASNAAIILRAKDGSFNARAVATNEMIRILDVDQEIAEQLFPGTVVNYVARSLLAYASDNLSQEKIFSFDPYIQQHKPISACCIPIITNEYLLGAIYLENNLAEGAFDSNRIGIFKTISSQLAISLDNVFLYEQMEQKVNDRTIELVQKNTELLKEKKKSDDLLLNILPAETAEELKNNGKTTAKLYKGVTVLFSDIREFSRYAEILSPEELVLDIDLYFRRFDEISTEHGLEKIKTIGDAYMAVGGVPANNRATVKDVINAAISMQRFTQELAIQRKQEGKHFFEIRVGIHTGPVIAGVVGIKKFQYDLWGDTVNISARMEQNSQPGKINISQHTYNLIKDDFKCTPRGKIRAKSLGEIDMYFVEYGEML